MDRQSTMDILRNLSYINTWIPKLFESELGISLVRYDMMLYLTQHKMVTQIEIQKYVSIDRAAITRHLQILEDKHYIERYRNPKDLREVFVSLTDTGYEVMTQCHEEHSAFIMKVFASLDIKQWESLANALEQLKTNVDTIIEKR